MRVGIDIVECDRLNKGYSDKTLSTFFSEYEIEYFNRKANKFESMAGIFSAKEAFIKATGVGIGKDIMLKDIEVRHDDYGRPYLNLSQNAIKLIHNLGLKSCDISISHTKNIATAICIIF